MAASELAALGVLKGESGTGPEVASGNTTEVPSPVVNRSGGSDDGDDDDEAAARLTAITTTVEEEPQASPWAPKPTPLGPQLVLEQVDEAVVVALPEEMRARVRVLQGDLVQVRAGGGLGKP